MKTTKKILALLLAVVMVLAMAAPALADDTDDGVITVTNAKEGETYEIVKIFDLVYKEVLKADGTVDNDKTKVSYTFTWDGTKDDSTAGTTASANGKLYAALAASDSLFTLTATASDSKTFVVELKNTNTTGEQIADFFNGILTEVNSTSGARELKSDFEDLLVGSKTAEEDQIVRFEGLEYGYYYILSSLGTIVTIDSTMKSVNVVDKNTIEEEFDKQVKDDAGNWGVRNTASVGDKVDFKITLNGTNYRWVQDVDENGDPAVDENGEKIMVKEYVTDYFIYDTMDDGLTLDPDSIVVKVKDNLEEADEADQWSTLDKKTSSDNGDYVLSLDSTVGTKTYDFVIQIYWGGEVEINATNCPNYSAEDLAANKGKKIMTPFYNNTETDIEITYSAYVNEDVDYLEANENAATYEPTYKKLPEVPDNPPPEIKIPEGVEKETKPTPVKDEIKTYTYDKKLVIYKIDGNSADMTNPDPLSGAKFKIEGTPLNIVLVDGYDYVVEDADFFTAYSIDDATADADNIALSESVDGEFDDATAPTEFTPTKYWLLKTGEYTADEPVAESVDFNTPWNFNDYTFEQAWKIVDTQPATGDYVKYNGKYYVGATQAEVEANKTNDGPEFYVKTTTKSNYDDYEDIAKVYKKVHTLKLDYLKDQNDSTNTDKDPMNNLGYTDEKGILTFTGLAAGNYTITELEAPTGYNLLTAPLYVQVVLEGVDSTGAVTTDTSKIAGYVLNAYESDSTFTTKGDLLGDYAASTTSTEPTEKLTIENKSGTELPSTGGIGTTIFITVGALVMIGAGVFFVTNQRMRKEGF